MIECLVGIGLISICILVLVAHQVMCQADIKKRLNEMYLFASSDKATAEYKPKIKMEYQSHDGMREIDNDNNSSI